MKTFEELWESCEDQILNQCSDIKLTGDKENLMNIAYLVDDLVYVIDSIEKSVLTESKDEVAEYLGYLLYRLSLISKLYNINIYDELRKVMEDEKTDLLERQLGSAVDDLKDQ